jgi:putative transposase
LVTSSRRSALTSARIRYLNEISGKARSDPSAVLAGRTGEHDHIHSLAGYPPEVSAGAPTNSPKGASAPMLRQRHQIRTHREHLWTPSNIAAPSEGAPLPMIRQHVEQ